MTEADDLRKRIEALEKSHAKLLDSAWEVERILTFAFDEGALPQETVMGLCIDPYGVLADLRTAIINARGLQDRRGT